MGLKAGWNPISRGVEFRKRHRWRPLLHHLPRHAETLAAIDLNLLQTSGIEGIILDLDNTIVSEDDRYLSPNALGWIQTAQHNGLKCCILSNSQRRDRVAAWSLRLGIPAISRARKPFPYSFHKVLAQMELHPSQVMVIGDSGHTDLLGAWWVGCPSIQVASLPHPLHWWEKLLGKRIQRPYSAHLQTLDRISKT